MESFKPVGPSESSKIRLYAEQQLRLLNQNENLISDKTRYSEWMAGLTSDLLGMNSLNKNNNLNRNIPKKGFTIVAGSNTNNTTSNNQNMNMNKQFDHTTLKVQMVTDDMRRASLSSLEKIQALRENIAIASNSSSGGETPKTQATAPSAPTTTTTTSVFDTTNTNENYSYNATIPATTMSNSSMMHNNSNIQAQVQAPPLESQNQVKTVHFDIDSPSSSTKSSSSSSLSESDINYNNFTSAIDTAVMTADIPVPTIYQEASSGTEADDITSSRLPPAPAPATTTLEKQEIEVDLSGTFKKGSIVAFNAAVEADLSGLTLDGARKFLAK